MKATVEGVASWISPSCFAGPREKRWSSNGICHLRRLPACRRGFRQHGSRYHSDRRHGPDEGCMRSQELPGPAGAGREADHRLDSAEAPSRARGHELSGQTVARGSGPSERITAPLHQTNQAEKRYLRTRRVHQPAGRRAAHRGDAEVRDRRVFRRMAHA